MHTTLFGTDGIRKPMGQEPLTPTSLMQLGNALGYWMTHQEKKRIALAHDTRQSSALMKAALKTGLLQHPLEVIDTQTLPTPALFCAIEHGLADVGIMITASHNQHQDNGLKIFTKENGKTTEQQEQEITDLFYTMPSPVASYEHLGTELLSTTAAKLYKEKIQEKFAPDFLKGKKIVVDCAHGAYYILAPQLFRALGAEVTVLANTPNGKNINLNCGSQYPEALQQKVSEEKADAGFAFDGDGDRMVMVNKQGTLYDGDQLLALLLAHSAYKKQTTVVSTIMANQGFEAHLAQHNITLERTSVGDKKVLKRMQELHCLVGGEPSGHIILRDFTQTSDGLFTALRVLEALEESNGTAETFTPYPQILINVPVKLKKDLSLNPYAQIIQKHKELLPDGRLVVRYSGTESLLRVMIEDQTKEHAQSIGAVLSQELADTLAQERE